MRINIRCGVFETNSSSTHSVSIGEGDLNDFPEIGGRRLLRIDFGEYDWEHEEFTTAQDRLSYAATYAHNYGGAEKERMLEEVIKENLKVLTIRFSESSECYEKGYIDHASHDEAASIFETKDTLARFLFNKDSMFETSNDNSDEWLGVYDSWD